MYYGYTANSTGGGIAQLLLVARVRKEANVYKSTGTGGEICPLLRPCNGVCSLVLSRLPSLRLVFIRLHGPLSCCRDRVQGPLICAVCAGSPEIGFLRACSTLLKELSFSKLFPKKAGVSPADSRRQNPNLKS